MDKISVIIPVYNVENYIRKCLDSVINQTYKNLEIILVDDGSTDKSGEICDEYALKDERIRVFHTQNGGVSLARNVGLKKVTGKYFTFVDSDDFVATVYVERLKEILEKNASNVSVCAYKEFFDDEEVKYNTKNEITVLCGRKMMENLLNGQKVFSVLWGKLYLYDDFKNFIFTDVTVGEDEIFVNELSLYNKIAYDSSELYFYRKNFNGLINSPFNLSKISSLKALEIRNNFLKDQGLNDLVDLNEKNILYKITYLYFECKKAGYKEQLKFLKIKYKEYYNAKNTSFNKKDKFRLKLFKNCPWLYRVITETNRRIKCRKK